MSRRGFTLIEMMFVAGALPLVVGCLFLLMMHMGDTTAWQQGDTTATQEAQCAVRIMAGELRQAAMGSLSETPAGELRFRVAVDADVNGVALDSEGKIELSGERQIRRDRDDVNKDGVGERQLLLIADGKMRVLANGLAPNEDANENGLLDAGEDANANGKLDRGLRFERAGDGLRVTVRTQRRIPRGRVVTSETTQVVVPRNP